MGTPFIDAFYKLLMMFLWKFWLQVPHCVELYPSYLKSPFIPKLDRLRIENEFYTQKKYAPT